MPCEEREVKKIQQRQWLCDDYEYDEERKIKIKRAAKRWKIVMYAMCIWIGKEEEKWWRIMMWNEIRERDDGGEISRSERK